ncbi:MAG: hypothetical protein Q4C98_10855 [Capnocytophaga sp.]|nr:hypothetical protein [Capnocytophaga sp.]
MDYAQGEQFTYTDWKQINDPKLKLYVFQGQSEGEILSLKKSPLMVRRYIEYFRCVYRQKGTIYSDPDKVDVYAENIEIGGKRYDKIIIEFLGKNNQEFKNSFAPKDYQNDNKNVDNTYTDRTIITLGKTIRFIIFPKNKLDLIAYLYGNDTSYADDIKRDFVDVIRKKTEKEAVEYINSIDMCTLSELDFELIKEALKVLTKNSIEETKEKVIIRLLSSIQEKDIDKFISFLKEDNYKVFNVLVSKMHDRSVFFWEGNNYTNFMEVLVRIYQKRNKDKDFHKEIFKEFQNINEEELYPKILSLESSTSESGFSGLSSWTKFSYNEGKYDEKSNEVILYYVTNTFQSTPSSYGSASSINTSYKEIARVSPLSNVVIYKPKNPISLVAQALEGVYDGNDYYVVPAIFLDYYKDKNWQDAIDKGVMITLDAVTIVASGGTALATKVHWVRRAWALAEVAGAVGNIAVNTSNVSPEVQKVIDTYNLAMGVIGIKNLGQGGYKFVKNLPDQTKKLLKENNGLKGFLNAKYLEWKTLTTNIDNLTDAEKQLIKKQEKVWKILGVIDDTGGVSNSLKKLINKSSSKNIVWKALDDKNIIWANKNDNVLSTAKSFANEIGNTLYDIVLQNGYYVKIDINDGRILLGNTNGNYYAFAVINDTELGTFKSSILNVSDEIFNTKLSQFLTINADKLKVLSGVVSKPLNIAGQTVVLSGNKVNTLLGRFRPDIANLFNELGSFKNVGLGETKGSINILNKPDFYYNPDNWWNAYNKPWLDRAIVRGDDIYMVTIPQKADDIIKEGKLLGAYAEELNYLATKNYKPKNISIEQWIIIKKWLNK